MQPDTSASKRLERWIGWAAIALGASVWAMLMRGVAMLLAPDRDQTLELYAHIALMGIASVCLLGLLFRHKQVRNGERREPHCDPS
jgi:hypothetical protein